MTTIELLRQYKIGEYAIFDTAGTLIAVYFLAPLLSKIGLFFKLKISRKSWLLLTIPISILVHKLVGTNTPMTQDFFNPSGDYLIKFSIIFLTFLGIKDITVVKSVHKKKK